MPAISQHILHAFAANHSVHGEKATIRAGDVTLTDIDVIPGRSEAQALGDDDLLTTIDLQDFQLRAGDLVVPGSDPTIVFKPDRGMIVEVVRDGQTLQFVVNHPNGNQAPFRRADAYGAILRVHTLQVEPSTPAE